MRTTVTLDPDAEQILRERMESQGMSFKQALNDAIRRSVAPRRRQPFVTRSVSLGKPYVNLDKALQVAGELEDEEIVNKMQRGA